MNEAECPYLLSLTAAELASSEPRIRDEMVARARIAARFGGRGHLEGFPSTQISSNEAGGAASGTCVRPTSIVVHAGARVRLTVRKGSPGFDDNPGTVLPGRASGWTCREVVGLRENRPQLSAQREVLLASNPGADCVESIMRLEKYSDEEVCFSLGHVVDNWDWEEYGCFVWEGREYDDIPAGVAYRGPVSV